MDINKLLDYTSKKELVLTPFKNNVLVDKLLKIRAANNGVTKTKLIYEALKLYFEKNPVTKEEINLIKKN